MEQRTEQLKHEAELNKVRNTPPPTRTTQQGGVANNTTNTTTQKIFKACAEVKQKSVMTYECQFSELDYYVTAFRSYYQMSENTQGVLPSQQQALVLQQERIKLEMLPGQADNDRSRLEGPLAP